MEKPIMPEIKIIDPRSYLAERVKRGVAFVAVVRTLGTEVEPCLSNHIQKPSTEAPEQLELFED